MSFIEVTVDFVCRFGMGFLAYAFRPLVFSPRSPGRAYLRVLYVIPFPGTGQASERQL